jgi:hypothetical protein
MAFGYKILGLKNGDATTQVAYTVPTGKNAIISSLVIYAGEDNMQYSIFVVPSGATRTSQHRILNSTSMTGGSTHSHQFGITLAAGDAIHFYGSAPGETSINLFVFGTEADV